jgi:hypothetical protein
MRDVPTKWYAGKGAYLIIQINLYKDELRTYKRKVSEKERAVD